MKKENMVTKKDMYNALYSIIEGMESTTEISRKGESIISIETLKTFINSEVALLEKKASYKSTKPTKTQEENEIIKEKILEVLKSGEKMTIKEMWKNSEELATITDRSTSKMSALLTQLREDGKVVRTYDKKVAYFSIA